MAEDTGILAELDAVWAEVSRTVVEGDFDGMAAVYHKDAVLVNSASGTSYPHFPGLGALETGHRTNKKRGNASACQLSFFTTSA